MKLTEIAELLNARVVCGQERLEEEQDIAFASDLMSDILTLGDNFPMIVTGLCTMQTIRTCEMGNLDIIVFVRKKRRLRRWLNSRKRTTWSSWNATSRCSRHAVSCGKPV